MLQILVIWRLLDDHIEFEWKFKFLMKNYDGILPVWWSLNEFWHLHHVEFDVKFIFFLKIYEVTWKLSWNMSYVVAIIWVLFPRLLSLVSHLGFCWNFCNYMERWLKYILFGGHQIVKFVPQHVEFGFKFSFLLKIYTITWKDGWNTSYLVATKCVLASFRVWSPQLKLKSRINQICVNLSKCQFSPIMRCKINSCYVWTSSITLCSLIFLTFHFLCHKICQSPSWVIIYECHKMLWSPPKKKFASNHINPNAPTLIIELTYYTLSYNFMIIIISKKIFIFWAKLQNMWWINFYLVSYIGLHPNQGTTNC
jgi:hypothetical protein